MKSSRLGNRGGRRENAGRKATWNHKDTITIRVPKVIATQVMEVARRLDCGEHIDFVAKSIPAGVESVTESKAGDIETITKSIPVGNEKVTKSIATGNEAIELAKKILKSKKSAIHSVGKLLSKLYSTSVSVEDLK